MRKLIITASIIVGIVALVATFGQRRELSDLKLVESRLQQESAAEPVVQAVPEVTSVSPPQYSPSSELLRLRGEVGQLERRKRELGGVRAENEILRTQLATKGTNAPGGVVLPAGYVRKADAKLAGFATPEDTIQSMLWAIENRDVATFVQVFSPEMAKQMESEIQRRGTAEEFFKEANLLPGLRIIEKRAEAVDRVVLAIEVIPGDDHTQKVRFKQFDGQWKMVSGF